MRNVDPQTTQTIEAEARQILGNIFRTELDALLKAEIDAAQYGALASMVATVGSKKKAADARASADKARAAFIEKWQPTLASI